jgi:hypothetical protein
MSFFDPFLTPGMGDPIESTEIEFTWGRPETQQQLGITIVSTARDAANTPTTTLRRGLLMGQVTSTKKFKEYSATATDGSQLPIGFLMWGRNVLDPRTGTAGDRVATLMVSGPIKVANVLGLDETARRLLAGRFLFDDFRFPPGDRLTTDKAADYTVVAADNGTFFTASAAANFTLPALADVSPGWNATFYNAANSNLTVTAPTGKLVAFNNAGATSVALSTSGNKIGSGFKIVMNAAGTFYLALPIGAGTVTVA